MKKIAIAFVLAALLVVAAACSKKRCACMTVRTGYDTAYAFEELGSHKNCADMKEEWVAVEDSSGDIITKTCTEED